jgi:hypothetical protein
MCFANWRILLREIHSVQVIPVIGPAAVCIEDSITGQVVPLQQSLAPELARVLGLENPHRYIAFNDVAREYLLHGGDGDNFISNLATSLIDWTQLCLDNRDSRRLHRPQQCDRERQRCDVGYLGCP